MPILQETALKKQITSRLFAPVYLIYGEEGYLVSHYVNLLSDVSAGELKDFNHQRLQGKFDLGEFTAAAEQLPVMNDFRCISICDLDFEKLPATDLAALKAVLSDPPQGCVILFYYENTQVKKTAKWRSVLKLIEKNGAVVQFERLGEQPLARLLESGAVKRGCRLELTAARRLIEFCGNDLRTLQGELDKLCAFAKEKGFITKEDVAAVCARSMETSVFQLSKYITAKKSRESFALLDQLFYQRAEPFSVLSVLSMAYLDMYRAKASAAAGQSAEAQAEFFACPPWRLRAGRQNAAGASLSSLRGNIKLLSETDIQMKSARVKPEILLQQTVAELLRSAERPSPKK